MNSVATQVILAFFLGGASILFAVLTDYFDAVQNNSLYFSWTFSIATIGALLIYQPHFFGAYRVSYGRGLGHVRRYPFAHIVLPVSLTMLALAVAYCEWTARPLFSPQLFEVVLMLTVTFGIYHFSAQSAAAVFTFAHRKISARERVSLKFLFFISGLWAVWSHIQRQNGDYLFFGLVVHLPRVNAHLLSEIKYGLSAIHFVLFAYALKKGWGVLGLVPWVACFFWFLRPEFNGRYFYLIPLFHSLQYIPFYFRAQNRSFGGWQTPVVILTSLLFIFALPNWIHDHVTRASLVPYSLTFSVLLMCLNLHHFALEAVAWRRAPSDRVI